MAFGSVNIPGGPLSELKQARATLEGLELTLNDLNNALNERTVNGKPLGSDVTLSAADVGARPDTWTPSAADVGAVPAARKVNGKVLSADISLSAADVGARPSSWTPTAADVGAKAAGWKPFHVGTAAPSDRNQLWVDTTATTGGLKYYNGSAWVHVPVAYT